MPLGLLLPLSALVAPVSLLYHARRLVQLPLLPVRQRQPAEIGLASTSALAVAAQRRGRRRRGVRRRCYRGAPDDLVGGAVAAAGDARGGTDPAVELKLQLEEVAEVGGRRRRRGRVGGQTATRGRGRTRLGVSVADRGSAAAALPVGVEQLAGVQRLRRSLVI